MSSLRRKKTVPPTTQSRVRGVLLGAAIGDALGAPYEFGGAGKVTAIDRYSTGCFGTKPGYPTDDSTLVRLHAEALLMEGSASFKMNYVGKLIRWRNSGPPDIGGQTSGAIGWWSSHLKNMASTSTGVNVNFPAGPPECRGAGNGSLMAVAPAALVATSVKDCAHRAQDFSNITHSNGECRYACRQVACAIYDLLHGVEAEVVLDNRSVPFPAGMQTDGSEMGYTLLAAAIAFWALELTTFDKLTPFQALVEVIGLGGDTDTNACIAGGLLGAASGYEGWATPGWILRDLGEVDSWITLADQLAERAAVVAA